MLAPQVPFSRDEIWKVQVDFLALTAKRLVHTCPLGVVSGCQGAMNKSPSPATQEHRTPSKAVGFLPGFLPEPWVLFGPGSLTPIFCCPSRQSTALSTKNMALGASRGPLSVAVATWEGG